MQTIVVSGSVSNQQNIQNLVEKLAKQYTILDYPKTITGDFEKMYSQIHQTFMKSIAQTDVLLLFNYDKNGVQGYIGAAGFAELHFAVSLHAVYGKNIQTFIYQMPDKQVFCYDEIQRWLSLGWIQLWEGEKI